MYSNDIDQCPPLVNQASLDVLGFSRAAPVVANTPLDIRDVRDAINEAKVRECLNVAAPHLITQGDLNASYNRVNALTTDYHTQLLNPGPGAPVPAWFGPAFTASLNDPAAHPPAWIGHITAAINNVSTTLTALDTNLSARIDNLSTRVDNLSTRVDNLSTRVDNLSTRMDNSESTLLDISIKVDNQEIRRRNGESFRSERLDVPLYPLRKTTAGIGPGLHDYVVNLPAGTPVANGDSFPDFPTNRDEIQSLSLHQLSALSAFYCDDFGILNRDSVGTRRIKFENFISFK
jgi:outer membrane murein-binding lipoprotein Lpp